MKDEDARVQDQAETWLRLQPSAFILHPYSLLAGCGKTAA